MNLRALLVDDEPLALDRLKLLLGRHADVEVVALSKNGSEAVDYLRTHPVDLMFLDIVMPGISGFDVVQEIGALLLPPTIFVTAFHEHAVRAFDVQAMDYVTKPIDPQRLEIALKRVRESIAAKSALLTQGQLVSVLDSLRASLPPRSYPARLMIRDGAKDIPLVTTSIEWIEAADYYSCLHVKGRTYLLRETISELTRRLDPSLFLRIHRSATVNMNFVREIFREGSEDGCVVLIDGTRLRLSRTGRQNLAMLR